MAQVVFKGVSKSFNGHLVVDSFTQEVRDKEFFILVGPSGCGKSTTLRMVAGLEEVNEGQIWIGGRLVNDVPPKDRDIAMVFQNYALYPHMTVEENMGFGLKLRGYTRREISTRVEEAAQLLGIERLMKRRPKELSGGQRQRVAVGRAIVRKPKVFLFDEPLSNLDAKLRVQMRMELSKLHDRLQATIIYVTHDQVEAMTMGDRICVMKDGVIQQVDTPLQVYNNPVNRFVAGFIGSPPMNFLEVELVEKSGVLWLNEGTFSLKIPDEYQKQVQKHAGRNLIMGIRPQDIFDRLFYPGTEEEGRQGRATVEVVEPMGAEKYLYLTTGRNSLVARVLPNNEAKEHQDIELIFNTDQIRLFDPETQEAII